VNILQYANKPQEMIKLMQRQQEGSLCTEKIPYHLQMVFTLVELQSPKPKTTSIGTQLQQERR
jgi:hypothetical protein